MAVLALVVVLAVSGCAVGYQPTSAPDRSPQPSDPPLGYYNGYWYNDTFDLDAEQGLSPGEKAAVVSRAMARIQLLRGMRFEEDIDIEIITRDEFNEEFDDVWHEPPPDRRLLDNAQHEALFLVGPDKDVVDVRRTNRGGVVLGFYQPSRERIVIVSGNDPATLDDEITLAHELLHALQDQRFGLASFDDSTLDSINARNGLVEGDAVVVQRAYERNCESGEWECVEIDTTSGSALPPDFHWGVYFLGFFPYAEGPEFVEYHRDRGGWEAVNPIYDDIPTASATIVSPETYRTDTHGEATIEDQNTPRWERVTVANGPDAATVGQAGLASMFAYTAYAGDSPGVIDRDQFRNQDSDGFEAPYDYDIEYASGWHADRLHAYEHDNQTAYVWNVTFVDEANATTFHDGYEQVLKHWRGDRQTVADGTVWTFDGSEGRFSGAVWVERDGNAVTVVKAPNVSEIESVYAPAGSD
jgi:hypothetical protein